MSAGSGRPQRAYLHVGAPKTGTTFVQSVLWQQRARLMDLGVLYPASRYDDHFFAAVDLQHLDFHGEFRAHASGRWEETAARVRCWPGTSVISHDVLASATPEQAATAIASLAPAEVHVVLSARDLARQLTSHWQEDVKHGDVESFDDWFRAVWSHDERRWSWRWFWRTEDLPDVLARWGGTLPPERVHLVTVPPSGASRAILWRRFASVIADELCDLELGSAPAANRGMNLEQIALLRRLNASLGGRLTQTEYEHLVKGVLAHETFPRVPRDGRPVLPTDLLPKVRARSEQWNESIREAGYDVAGDLADLLPDVAGHRQAIPRPDEVTETALLDVATSVIPELLLRLRDERVERRAALRLVQELQADNSELAARLQRVHKVLEERAALPPGERIRRTVVEIADTRSGVDTALRLYRRTRRLLAGLSKPRP